MKQEMFTSKISSIVKVSAKKAFAVVAILCLLLIKGVTVSAQTETLSTGSYIINMGVVPQTRSNALKPYGLVYDLLKNYNAQIKWVISPTKVKDGADFTYNGVQYKGGTFIIPAQYRTAAVNGRITFFGVTGTTTTTPLTVNVTYTLKTAPSWTLDVQNGNIAAGFFDDAGIPASAYDSKTPAQLNGCDDIYVMPHADADWAYYGPLRNWVLNHRGSFWGGCRTGSQIENLYNPAIPSQQMNFLSNKVGRNALVPHDDHQDGTPPYIHQFPNSPVSQYMGVTDGAHQGGSEQIYLPVLNGSWRATTQLINYDPTQQNVPALSPGPASAIVFGRAYGDPANGYVMYEGGHNIGGTGVDEIAAQRAFWNFSLLSSIDKVPVISPINLNNVVFSGNVYAASITASSPNGSALSYQWSSSCGGTFSSPTSATTNFTAPIVTVPTSCTITVTVTDACGRGGSETKIIQVFPNPPVYNPDINVTYVNVPVPGNVQTNDVVPAGTNYGTPVPLAGNPPSGSITMNTDGTYSFVSPNVGVYRYTVPVCVPGQAAPCPTTLLTITVLGPNTNNNPPVANTDIATTMLNTPVTLRTLANDYAGNPGGTLNPASVAVTVNALHGTTTVNSTNGNITYTPAAGYSGMDTLTYRVCDNSTPTALCATAIQIITIKPAGTPNSTAAADDYVFTPINTSVTGNAMTNDTDPEGNSQSITPQTTTIAGKGTLVLAATGVFTFTPVAGFTGPVSFPYTTTDNGTPVATAKATIYILVSPPQPVFNPDINVTYVNVPVPGNVRTNDVVPSGTTYGTPAPLAGNPPSGTITMNSDGTYSFVSPNVGVYRYNVPVCVPGEVAPCPTTLLTITVLGPNSNNNPPVANTDIATTRLNTPVTLNSLANDYAGNIGGTLNPASVTVTVNPLHGTATVNNATGNITYTPAAGYSGMDTLTYRVCDNSTPTALCATALQIITIKPAGAPNSTAAADDYVFTPLNTPVTGNAMTNDTDPEGNSQSITTQTITIAGKGTLVLNANGTFTFTPIAGFSGPVNFPYTTTDNGTPAASANATIYILVSPAQSSTNPDFNSTFVNVPVPGNVSTNDRVPAGTSYGTSPTLLSGPAGSNPSIAMNANGTYTFVSDVKGVYVYDVPVCMPGQTAPCPPTKLTITVLDATVVTNSPVANVDIAITRINTPVTLKSLANDAAGNASTALVPSTVTITTAPLHGTATVNTATGDITYTPAAGYTGTDTLRYQVCDDQVPSKCASANQIITIRPLGAPNTTEAADDYKITGINTVATGNVKINDIDPEGNTQTVTAQNTTIAGKGNLVLNANGDYTFTPVTGFTGPVDFPYTTCDNGVPQACAMATLHILVRPFTPVPDLTPNITTIPNIIQDTMNFNVVVRVQELDASPTNGSEILVRIIKDSRITFTYNPALTNIGFSAVQNNVWTYDGSDPFFHLFRTNTIIAANGASTFGFVANFNPGGKSRGKYTMTASLNSGSGGETKTNNNQDAEVLDYLFK